jgi:hypothetical protein
MHNNDADMKFVLHNQQNQKIYKFHYPVFFMKTLRQKFNNIVQEKGNKVYDGLGDVLTAEVSPRGLASIALLGTLALGGAGCGGTRMGILDTSKLIHNYGFHVDHMYPLGDLYVPLDDMQNCGQKKLQTGDSSYITTRGCIRCLNESTSFNGQELAFMESYLDTHGTPSEKDFYEKNGFTDRLYRGSDGKWRDVTTKNVVWTPGK